MKYQVVYKCSLCNGLIAYGDPKEMTKEQCVDVIAKVLRDQQFIGNPLYRSALMLPHCCSNNNIGAAYFAGLKEVPDGRYER